jgi:hypothetical protein
MTIGTVTGFSAHSALLLSTGIHYELQWFPRLERFLFPVGIVFEPSGTI